MDIQEDIKTGDIITFGRYSLEAWEYSPIEWIVLAKEEARLLLLSRYGLDTQPYNNKWKSVARPPYYNDFICVTWEVCTLRQWLNGMFYEYSFNEDEKKLIWLSKLENPVNPEFGTWAGNPTLDRVFLLSLEEAEKYLHSDEERFCRPTEWAKCLGAETDEYTGASLWWLRTPGFTAGYTAVMNDNPYCGEVSSPAGRHISNESIAVRPALWMLYL